jgi:hypothetical protein
MNNILRHENDTEWKIYQLNATILSTEDKIVQKKAFKFFELRLEQMPVA